MYNTITWITPWAIITYRKWSRTIDIDSTRNTRRICNEEWRDGKPRYLRATPCWLFCTIWHITKLQPCISPYRKTWRIYIARCITKSHDNLIIACCTIIDIRYNTWREYSAICINPLYSRSIYIHTTFRSQFYF